MRGISLSNTCSYRSTWRSFFPLPSPGSTGVAGVAGVAGGALEASPLAGEAGVAGVAGIALLGSLFVWAMVIASRDHKHRGSKDRRSLRHDDSDMGKFHQSAPALFLIFSNL